MDNNKITIDNLKDLLLKSWCAETAVGKWIAEVPSMNQCAVTALVVQDLFGGNLLRCNMTDGDSHYWNKIADGTEIDLTEEQFNHIDGKPLRETVVIRQRDYVLSYPNTMYRYGLLLQKIAITISEGE